MNHPKELSIHAFQYDLPEERIATHPKESRDSSKLLVWKDQEIREDVFSNIIDYLPAGSLMIFNNTRVVEARLLFQKPTGAKIELFCLEPAAHYPDITTALSTQGRVKWKCLVGNASAWTPGLALQKILTIPTGNLVLRAEMVQKFQDHAEILLSWAPEQLSFAEVLHLAGLIPLPPYIKRKLSDSDAERYQTVYADFSGSVAAPTAGLHFTPAILEKLGGKNIRKDFVTLHVGAGTFKPVKAPTMAGHHMHAEPIEINLSLVEQLCNDHEKDIIAVGTTSLRTIESLYWLGKKLFLHHHLQPEELSVEQWDPYDHAEHQVTVPEALFALRDYMIRSGSDTLITKTSLLIAPGYAWKLVTVLVTNFHQPQSTLLLLVSAFIGENWRKVYSFALENDYRFLSYGDACLFFRQ